MNLIELSAFELVEGLKQGQFSAQEVNSSFADQVDLHDSKLKAFLRFNRQECLEQAAKIDSTGGKGNLAGIPIAVKDVICIQGQKTTCGSRMLEEFIAPYDATLISRLKKSDGVFLGKTNMDEFAMGSSTENSAFGRSCNPWHFGSVPGGSSGGAASCVAASLAPLSIGSDTGGSVRQPAAFCGVTGLKPTYGRVSRYGLIAFASSLDQIGFFARDARDVALILNESAGHDQRDSTSSREPIVDYLGSLGSDLSGLKIGLPIEYQSEGLSDEIQASVVEARRVLESLGAQVREISLPMTQYGVAAYYLIASCEASGNLARYDGAHYGFRARCQEDQKSGSAASTPPDANRLLEMYCQTRSKGFGPEVKRRIMLGTYALSAGYYDAYYLQALKIRRLIQNELREAFAEVDMILGPTTPTPAYRFGEKSKDPLSMYLGDIYTVVANLAGIPAISFPAGFSAEKADQPAMPIGLQLQGPAFAEAELLKATWAFQNATDWHQRRPVLDGVGG